MLPKSFSKVVEAADMLRGNIADIERSVIGLDHMVVGKRLAERWRLPDSIRDCAWLHGQIPQALPATVKNPRLVNLITLADVIVREQHLGFSGNFSFSVPKQALLDAVGLTPEQLEPVMRRARSRTLNCTRGCLHAQGSGRRWLPRSTSAGDLASQYPARQSHGAACGKK